MPQLVTQDQIKFYQENGYLVIDNFLSPAEVELLRNDIKTLIANKSNEKDLKIEGHVKLMGTKPMLDSVHESTFFYEKRSINDNGQLIDPLEKAVHKIAHGVHLSCEGAKSVTFSDKMKELIKSTSGFINPVLIQGMFILKQPKIGEESPTHIDETYLITNPIGNVMGAWIAIDDSTEENGCLQFVPGSHKDMAKSDFPLWVRDEDKMKVQATDPHKSGIAFVGESKYDKYNGKFVKAAAKSGSLVLIHGLAVHKSDPNSSSNPRAAYTFHVYDKANSTWDKRNWAQESNGFKMPSLY